MLNKFLLSLVLFFPTLSFSYEVTAYSKIRHCCTGYYSITYADYSLNLSANLPQGTRVYLHRGFNIDVAPGSNFEEMKWQEIRDIEFSQVSPDKWTAIETIGIRARSGGGSRSKMQFVIKIIFPNGDLEYVKGSNSRLGYYEIKFPEEPHPHDSYQLNNLVTVIKE